MCGLDMILCTLAGGRRLRRLLRLRLALGCARRFMHSSAARTCCLLGFAACESSDLCSVLAAGMYTYLSYRDPNLLRTIEV